MARKPRIHYSGALYHVIARGNQRHDIFISEADFRTYLKHLAEYKEKYHFHLYAYALMRNHLHLLLEVEQIPLSRIMHVLQFRYTRYFNKRYGKVEHLFQGRYKAILCEKDVYLLELVDPEKPTIFDFLLYSWGIIPLGSLKRKYNKKRKNI